MRDALDEIMDFDEDGFCLTAEGLPYMDRRHVSSTDNDPERDLATRVGKPFEQTLFPSYQAGDTIVRFGDFWALSGQGGFLLVRDRRVIQKRVTMMS